MTRFLLALIGLIHDLIPKRFWTWLESMTPPPLPATPPQNEWFEVTFDEVEIRLEVKPPGTARCETFQWQQIERICYRVEYLGVSDGIYLFLAQRDGSLAVPVDAKGGFQFWQEILRRNRFDTQLAIEVATAIDGTYCWPEAA